MEDTNGRKTKVDVDSWVSLRIVISVLVLVASMAAAAFSIRQALGDVSEEVRDLRKDVKVSLRILANTVSVASDDRHTAAAEIAIWNEVGMDNPDFVIPDVKRHQLENQPKAKSLYIPMLDD